MWVELVCSYNLQVLGFKKEAAYPLFLFPFHGEPGFTNKNYLTYLLPPDSPLLNLFFFLKKIEMLLMWN